MQVRLEKRHLDLRPLTVKVVPPSDTKPGAIDVTLPSGCLGSFELS